jgi:hypothetical protein
MLVILVGTLVAWGLKLEPELVLVCLPLATVMTALPGSPPVSRLQPEAWRLKLDACGPDQVHARTHRRELLS